MCNNCGGIAGSQEGPPGQNRQCSGICVQNLSAMAENIMGAEHKPKVVWYWHGMIPASTCRVVAYLWDVPEPVYMRFYRSILLRGRHPGQSE